MPPDTQPAERIAFGSFELEITSSELFKKGRRVRLSGQSADLLTILVSRSGKLVSREELRLALWPEDTFVDFDHGLNNCIRRIRDVLGDSAESPRYIETLPKKGYRFIAETHAVLPLQSVVAPPDAGNTVAVTVTATAAQLQEYPLQMQSGRWKRLGPWVVSIFLILATVSLFLFGSKILKHRSAAEFSSIAVLPLEQLSGDPNQDYFADGMTDALITDLAQITSLRVISRTSAMHFKGTHLTVPEIAQQLGVDAVVEGSVTRSGNHVRITAQLVDARQDRHLWAGSYAGEMSDILNLQDTVATSIAREVNTKLTSTHEERPRRPVQPAAYEAYLKGWHFWNRFTWEDWRKAIQYFQESINVDPNYAPAYVGLSESYAMLGFHNSPMIEVMPKAKEAAQKALMLDDSLGEAHIALANVLFGYEWDWAGAEREFQRGFQLSPNYALGYHWHSIYLQILGHQAEGIAEQKKAVALDPLSLTINTNLCQAYLFAKQLDAAIQQCRKTLELDPHFGMANRWLTQALYEKGAYQEYVEALESGVRRAGIPEWADEMNKVFSAGGIERFQRYMAEDDLENMKENPLPAWRHAKDYVQLGDKENALRWLEKSYEDRDFGLLLIGINDEFAPLRSEPRYINIRRKMNLPY